ncbi:hypothetical protein J1G18_07470 [Pseudomonas sp. MIS38]|uniref:hypothetical protein n=1 Tax=Pseudomonas sp. MIS38 TaxID=91465 RepID=UPI001CA6F966|nr:hypothetical protein [Pseudomonas sp. MIS38]MBY8957121.1 hypothetical protein [Pseudomonas sp. MIS38]
MIEFNNRIDAQRAVLNYVNRVAWHEELHGLSRGAIDRWVRVNNIDPDGELVLAILEAAGKLFFLANKSQEQVTDEYRLLSVKVNDLTLKIANILKKIS